jgi:hypothetical protein
MIDLRERSMQEKTLCSIRNPEVIATAFDMTVSQLMARV